MKSVWIFSVTASALMSTVPRALSSNAAQGQPGVRAAAEVKIEGFRFTPETLTVALGTTLTWTNRDDAPHLIVSTEGIFKSKPTDTDETFSYTFAKAGTYPYYCAIHPRMTGRIVVRP